MILIQNRFSCKTFVILFLIQFIAIVINAQNDTVPKKLQWYVSAGLNANFPFKEVIDPSIPQSEIPFLSYYDRNIALGGAISTELKIKINKNFNIETGLMFIMRSSKYSNDSVKIRELQTTYPYYHFYHTEYYYLPISFEIPLIFLFNKNKWEFGVGSNIRAYTFLFLETTDINKNNHSDFYERYSILPTLYPVIKASYTVSKHKISIYGYYRHSKSIDVLLAYSFEIYKK